MKADGLSLSPAPAFNNPGDTWQYESGFFISPTSPDSYCLLTVNKISYSMTLSDICNTSPAESLPDGSLFIGRAHEIEHLAEHDINGCRIFLMVCQGSITAEINGRSHDMKACSLADVFENSTLRICGISRDASAYCMIPSYPFINDSLKNLKLIPDSYILDRVKEPVMQFTEEETARMERQFTMITNCVRRQGHHYRKEQAKALFRSFMLEAGDILVSHSLETETRSTFGRRDMMTVEFLKLVWQNFRTEHNIKFYADRLCVSVKHLSRVVRETTGRTPGSLIRDELLRCATTMLEDERNTAQSIAAALHFADQAAFCKFFKKQTGLSPMEQKIKDEKVKR